MVDLRTHHKIGPSRTGTKKSLEEILQPWDDENRQMQAAIHASTGTHVYLRNDGDPTNPVWVKVRDCTEDERQDIVGAWDWAVLQTAKVSPEYCIIQETENSWKPTPVKT